ncbi:MAG: hypothetical protein JO107_00100 [Hyphomicrobiales bacterium]|nr:hypothetical protein [Hyphomicrobiales bacterium]
MTTVPEIVTFYSLSAPGETCWIARYREGRTGYLPLIFHAPTQELAERAAIDWWDAEQRKRQARIEAMKARAAGRRRAA